MPDRNVNRRQGAIILEQPSAPVHKFRIMLSSHIALLPRHARSRFGICVVRRQSCSARSSRVCAAKRASQICQTERECIARQRYLKLLPKARRMRRRRRTREKGTRDQSELAVMDTSSSRGLRRKRSLARSLLSRYLSEARKNKTGPRQQSDRS